MAINLVKGQRAEVGLRKVNVGRMGPKLMGQTADFGFVGIWIVRRAQQVG